MKDAGVLHLRDGTWSPSTDRDPDFGSTIYNANAHQPFYLRAYPRIEYGDFGRIPGTGSPPPEVGLADRYEVTGFQFAYCTTEATGDFEYTVSFYDDYRACAPARGPMTRVARFALPGLPGSPTPGETACWVVTVDLRGRGEFVMRADGGDGWDNFVVKDSFGFGISKTGDTQFGGGPLLAGDPIGRFGPRAYPGDGTVWHCDGGTPGTGLGTEDALWTRPVHSPDPPDGCVELENSFRREVGTTGTITYASFHLQLYANLLPPPCGSTLSSTIGLTYCDPAAANSTGQPGRILVSGSERWADDDLVLRSAQLPPGSVGFFLMGNDRRRFVPAGSPGPICVGGSEMRRIFPGNARSIQTLPDGFASDVGTRSMTCVEPGSTWNFQAWYRDGSQASNLTDAVSVTFR